jgi:hypothetical protein
MTVTTRTGRAAVARERLDRLLTARPETRHQELDSWLQVATGAEVRRYWPRVVRETGMRAAAIPPWAQR